jgi:ankyrin repeat protein
LDFDASIDIPSLTGEYPHHLAAQNGHLEILRMLVESGADPNQGRNDGVTPLQMAVMGTADLDTIKYLLKSGAHPQKHGMGSVSDLFSRSILLILLTRTSLRTSFLYHSLTRIFDHQHSNTNAQTQVRTRAKRLWY